MRLLAHAKINWSLAVLSRRADGYHELDSLMQSVGLSDELSLFEAEGLRFSSVGGVPVPQGADNLALRAARALQEASGVGRGARMLLRKRIPTGAGLGGGSADAAAALVGLNIIWKLNFSERALCDIARTLGADVPFCVAGGLARARGVGEALTPVRAAREYPLVIVKPAEGLPTPDIFRAWDAMSAPPPNPDIGAVENALSRGDAAALASAIGNALTEPAVARLPQVAACAQALTRCGALSAWMTGSGSAVVGLFATDAEAARARRDLAGIWRFTYQTRTSSRGVTILSE